jgi:hypothetical protein
MGIMKELFVKNPSINIRGFRALNLGFFIRKSLVERWCGYRILAFHPPGETNGAFSGFSRKEARICLCEIV